MIVNPDLYHRFKSPPTMPLIAPSLLAADFANLQRDCEMVNESDADWFHLDIMDGHFVPNISFGLPVIEAIKRHARKPLDVHLMIEKPERYLENFKNAGADVLTVHLEASPHLHRSLQAIHGLQMKAGVALNPHTPVSLLREVLPMVDLVCLMSVNPGFGGQKFIEQTYSKIQELRKMIDESDSPAQIEIDGGVGLDNAQPLVQAGADVLVAGSSVFKADDPRQSISALKRV
jgi:ribulose-phosphate 3-epimerase